MGLNDCRPAPVDEDVAEGLRLAGGCGKQRVGPRQEPVRQRLRRDPRDRLGLRRERFGDQARDERRRLTHGAGPRRRRLAERGGEGGPVETAWGNGGGWYVPPIWMLRAAFSAGENCLSAATIVGPLRSSRFPKRGTSSATIRDSLSTPKRVRAPNSRIKSRSPRRARTPSRRIPRRAVPAARANPGVGAQRQLGVLQSDERGVPKTSNAKVAGPRTAPKPVPAARRRASPRR